MGRAARKGVALLGLTLASFFAAPASAELGYTYFEVGGFPFLQSPKVSTRVRDLLGEKQKVNVQVDGWGVDFDISYDVSEYFHFFARYQYTESDTNDINFDGVLEESYRGRGQVSQHAFAVGPGLHLAMSDRTDVVVELAFLYTRPKVELVGTLDLPDFLGGGSIPVDSSDKEDQFGILGRMGLRHQLWKPLELFAYMSVQSVNLTTNNVFWELGGIYTPIDWAGLNTALTVGTDGNVGVRLALRFYYDKFFKE